MDRLATRTDPLLHAESYVYDNNGNLSQFTDRKSQVTTYTYDALNRRTQMTYADLSTTAYTYDAGNRLTQVVDLISGTITRAYDGLDRLTSETTPQGSVSYTYDATGRRASMTVTGQPAISYTYDNANRLTQITQGSLIVTFAYDAAGRRTSLTLPNGILVEYGYDTASRVTSITYKQGQIVLGNLTYEYDKAGNRTKIGGSFARTGIPEAVTSSNYNAGNQQTTLGDKTMTYDNNGNLTGITDETGTTLYTWTAKNQLAGISGPAVTASFVYDGFGRREKKTIGGNLTEFLFDGVNPVQETSGATVLANTLTGIGVDDFLTRTDVSAGTTNSFLTDALGSAVALTNGAGIVQTEYTYEPFGQTAVTGASNNNPFQYTGRENDSTSVYYYRNRYYHPTLQRFISEDPIGFSGGVNFYTYTGNNPITYRDPLGLCTDPGGTGLRYCMNRYIYDPTSAFIFRGNDRAPESNGGDFKSQQMFNGNGNSSCRAGTSVLRWVNIPRRGSVGTCDGYQTPLGGRKDGRQINLDTTATHGFLTFAPPIQTTVTINESPNGEVDVNVWGTPYPSVEIWQYVGPNGPKLIYHQGAKGSPIDLYSRDGFHNDSRVLHQKTFGSTVDAYCASGTSIYFRHNCSCVNHFIFHGRHQWTGSLPSPGRLPRVGRYSFRRSSVSPVDQGRMVSSHLFRRERPSMYVEPGSWRLALRALRVCLSRWKAEKTLRLLRRIFGRLASQGLRNQESRLCSLGHGMSYDACGHR